jgi:uncharacterized protein DUF4258
MLDASDILMRVRSAAQKRVLFLPHAVRQMIRPERMITTEEVRQVIAEGVVIEDYPADPRGHSCLILGRGDNNRPVHLVCSPKEDYLAIITAYIPDSGEWSEDFRVRIGK